MKIILRFLILTIFLFSQYAIVAQSAEIKWSTGLEKGQAIEIIGEFDDHLYASRTNYKLIKDSKVNFLKINKKTLKLIEELSMNSITSNNNILYSKINDGKVEFLVLREKSIRVIVCDLELNEISDEEVIKLEKEPMIMVSYGYNKSNMIYKQTLTSTLSKDESKIVLKIEKPNRKKIDIEYHIFDSSEGYNFLYSKKLELNKKPNFLQIKDTNIGSDGSLNLLVKKYNTKKQNESKKKKPNYNYIVLKIGAEGEIKELELPNQTNFWQSPKIVKSKNGAIVVTAMTIAKPKRDANPYGIQFISIDQDESTIINQTYDINDVDERLEMYESSEIVDFVSINDSLFIVISEEMKATSGAQNKKYYLGNIVFEGFNNEGKHLWTNIIYRDVVVSENYSMFSKFKIFQKDEELSLFYITKKNTDILNTKDQKRESLSGKKNTILQAKLFKNGELKFDKVLSIKKLIFCPYYIQQINDDIYLSGSTDNQFRKSNFGVLQY